MDTSHLSTLYQSKGPFATVLTDVSHDNENGEHEHELRVRAVGDRLADQGADESVVEQVRERLGELVSRPAPVSRLVVATADGIPLDELAAVRVDQPVATWAPFPDLGSWIEHRDGAVTFVLAVVDHVGGDVALYDSDVPAAEEEAAVGGEDRFVHKVPVGGWSALRYQHTTENVWARNAEAVVDEVVSHVRRGHRLVLTGDPQSVGLVRDRLADSKAEVVELHTGSRAEDGGDEARAQAIREALMEHVVGRRLGLVHDLRDRLGRGSGAATGVDDVADAFVRGQVDTLLLDPRAAAELELDLTRHPGLVLGDTDVTGPVRADLALVAAAVLTGAHVSVSRSAALGTPVAALLRWSQDAVGTENPNP
jgi:Bacterial archaeo-eukaryotic release factor family 2